MKKIIALFLAILMCSCVVSCGKKDTADADKASKHTLKKSEFSKAEGDLASAFVPREVHPAAKEAAEKLRESVRNSKDELEFSGRIFYVSANGDDQNDGKSEKKPWKTISRVNSEGLTVGDAVLFRRGDVFRGKIKCAEGVTYAAYGKGDKPTIYGSVYNYSMKEWKKAEELDNVYYCLESVATDVGLVVLDHGKAYGQKHISSPNFFKANYDFYYDPLKARVYMRCDEGNPADVFADIEFCTYGTMVALKNNVTIDNLCLKYTGGHLASGADLKNIIIQNCEMGWVGGSMQYGNYYPGTGVSDIRYGNAFEVWNCCDNILIKNNYVYQAFDAALTHQGGGEHDHPIRMENVTYDGNLIEYSNCAFEYWNTQSDDPTNTYGMKNILYENNVVLHTGFGFGGFRYRTPGGIDSMCGQNLPSRAENFVVRNNIFDGSKSKLLTAVASERGYLPKMENNVYIHKKGLIFGYWFIRDKSNQLMFNDEIKDKIISLGIDENPTVYFRED